MFTLTEAKLVDQPFRLLDLPPELRLIIYRIALCSSPVMPYSNPLTSCEKPSYLSAPILCTSHKVHDEALEVLRSEGLFVVGVCSTSIRFLSRVIDLGKAQPFQPPTWLNTIRHLQIDLLWYPLVRAEDQGTELAENLRTVVHALKDNPVLRTLEISFYTPHGPTYFMSEDWIQNEAFDSLKRLRIKQVTLSGNFLRDNYVSNRLQELKLIIEGATPPDGTFTLERKWLDLKALTYSYGGIELDGRSHYRFAMRSMLRGNDEGFEASTDALKSFFRSRNPCPLFAGIDGV